MSEEAKSPPGGNGPAPPKFSVVVAFRNREIARVRRFLAGFAAQTCRDFELIFVDYGSDPGLSAETEDLLGGHAFARYLYNDTRGMPWNRAHALNSGAWTSRGEFMLFTDVDLIYSRGVLAALAAAADSKAVLYGGFCLLPRGFAQWQRLDSGEIAGLPSGPSDSLGAIQVVPREAFFGVQGFDEFFKVWGVEDFDLNRRLVLAGCASRRLSLPAVYHQWHASGAEPEMPAGWLEVMNLHSVAGLGKEGRDRRPRGLRLDAGLRPSRRADLRESGARRHVLPVWRRSSVKWLPLRFPGLYAWAKISFIRDFFGDFAAATSGEVFVCEVRSSPAIRIWELLGRTLLRRLCRPVGGRRFFDYRREARDIIWYAIALSDLVSDYNIEAERGVTRYTLVRK